MPYLSALEMSHYKALYKSTYTLLFTNRCNVVYDNEIFTFFLSLRLIPEPLDRRHWSAFWLVLVVVSMYIKCNVTYCSYFKNIRAIPKMKKGHVTVTVASINFVDNT